MPQRIRGEQRWAPANGQATPGSWCDVGNQPRCDCPRAPGVGAYLTSAFLCRVVGIDGSDGETLELEDCFGLDVVRVPASDVRAALRVVLPAMAAAGR